MYIKIAHPHDALFKEALAHKVIREEMLGTCLPTHILEKLDLSTITSSNKSYIDQDLREFESDVLLLVKNKSGNDNFIYVLIEHQRTSQKFLPARIFNYKAKIIADYIKQYPSAEHIPAIYSIVYYNGEKAYSESLDFFDLFTDPEIMRDSIISPLNLYDLNTVPDNIIRQRTFMSLIDYCMKYAPKKIFIKKVEEFCQIIYRAQQDDKMDISDLIEILFKYIINVIPNLSRKKAMAMLKKHLSEGDGKEKFICMGEGIWEDGKLKGIQEGKLKGIQEGKLKGIQEGKLKGIQEGKLKGIQEGKLKGIQEGMHEAKLKMATSAYKQGVSLEIISKMTGYSQMKLNKLLSVNKKNDVLV